MPIVTLEPPIAQVTKPTVKPVEPKQKKSYYKPKYNQVNSKYSFENNLTQDDIDYLAGFMADRVRWICSQKTLRPHDLAVIAGSGREQVRWRLDRFKSARDVVFDIVKKEG